MNGRFKQTMRAAAVTLAMLAASATGCAAPAKVIKAITNNNDQIKFLYVQGNSQGIIKCTVGAAGALSQCREMAVVLAD
jgi:hypothetical protein